MESLKGHDGGLGAPDLSERLSWGISGWGSLVGSSISELFSGKLDRPVVRAGWLLVVLPLVTLKLLVDGLCLLLDDLFFTQARDMPVREPLFVLGPPRSGTTFLHRVLAEDRDQFVTSPAWEVLLAPSIVQKKFFRAVLALDRKLGRPLVRGVRWLEKRLLSAFEDTHPGSLADPEEDYFYLSSICACSGWILAFPSWTSLRSVLPGQPEASDAHRRRALAFYKSCLQKQLFVDGGHRTVLSKNASFSSWMDVLPEFFPDARFVVSMRDPAETVPSMLSTAGASIRAAAATAGENRLQDLLIEEMKAHYRCLHEVIPTLPPERAAVLSQPEFKQDLEKVLRAVSAQLRLEFSTEFWEKVSRLGQESRSHRSSHIYGLTVTGVSPEELRTACPVLESRCCL